MADWNVLLLITGIKSWFESNLSHMETKRKPGRPKGTIKGRTVEAVTVTLRIDAIVKAGGMEAVREQIRNKYSKL